MYDANSDPCFYLNSILPSARNGQHDYYDWPVNKPFLMYSDTFRHILEEGIVRRQLTNGDLVTIHLASFSRQCRFLGFKTLRYDLLRCGQRNDQRDLWRSFGFNTRLECVFDLGDPETTDFFDPFLEDMPSLDSNVPVLRPLPILVQNYRTPEGDFVNQDSDDSRWVMSRRFFLYDNYTSGVVVQYAKSISLVFEINKKNHNAVYVPYLEIEYGQVKTADLPQNVIDLDRTKVTKSHPEFVFNVTYMLEMTSFWDAVLYVFIIAIILALTYWFVHAFMYLKSYGYAGVDAEMILAILADFCETIAALFLLILLVFALYSFFAFKWSNSMSFFLPPEEDFAIFFPVLCVSLAFKCVAALIKVWIQTNGHIFLIDWDKFRNPPARRFVISAEWSKLLGVRSYSVPFSLFVLILLIDGLDFCRLASPIPSNELIESGKLYPILTFAFTAFVWLLLFLVQWAFVNFVYWKIFGDPFQNFLALCRRINMSVLVLLTKDHGFYAHGRSGERKYTPLPMSHVSESEEEEEEEEEDHREPESVTRQLDDNLEHPVYEVYLTLDLAMSVQDKRNEIRLGMAGHWRLYDSLNAFLRRFFAQHKIQDHYLEEPYSILQVVDLAPIIMEDSVFTPAPQRSFRHTLLYGIQGSLMMAYLTVFSVIEIVSGSASVGGFVVFCIDVLVQLAFKHRGRYKLVQKTLLDDAFIG
jgi:hypothetical protein